MEFGGLFALVLVLIVITSGINQIAGGSKGIVRKTTIITGLRNENGSGNGTGQYLYEDLLNATAEAADTEISDQIRNLTVKMKYKESDIFHRSNSSEKQNLIQEEKFSKMFGISENSTAAKNSTEVNLFWWTNFNAESENDTNAIDDEEDDSSTFEVDLDTRNYLLREYNQIRHRRKYVHWFGYTTLMAVFMVILIFLVLYSCCSYLGHQHSKTQTEGWLRLKKTVTRKYELSIG